MTLHVRPLTDDERTKIERLTHAQTVPVRLARRARIIALAATGLTVPTIAHQIQQSEECVRRWIERFNRAGLEGLDDAPRSGRPRTYPEDAYSRVIAKAQELPPKPAEGEVPPTCHCSTYCLRTRAIVGWLTSTASAIAWSANPGPSGPWSAFNKMRACVSLRADSVPAVSKRFKESRSAVVRVTT
jgi:transposase